MIELNCPLIVFDTETTGVHPKVDRIVQIGLVKMRPDGRNTTWKTYVNPGIPIPPESTDCHGITDETVKGAPSFAELAVRLRDGFKGCDYGGFNAEFDLKMMAAEFDRAGVKCPLIGRVVDAMAIYRKYHPRTLTECVKEYLGESLDGAHDAGVDAEATARLFPAMLARHADLPRTVEGLHVEFQEQIDPRHVDPEGKFYWRYGEACFNFSEHAGLPLRVVDRGMLSWMLKKDFSEPVKAIVRDALNGRYPKKPAA